MKNVAQKNAQDPHWDGMRMLFQMMIDGKAVSCAISKSALRDVIFLHSKACFDPMSCFLDNLSWIEAIARAKYTARHDPLHVWPGDVFALPAGTAIGPDMQPEQFARPPSLSRDSGVTSSSTGYPI